MSSPAPVPFSPPTAHTLAPPGEEIARVREAIEAIDQLLDGLTQPETACRLDVSLATVERDLRRAYLHCLTQPPGQP